MLPLLIIAPLKHKQWIVQCCRLASLPYTFNFNQPHSHTLIFLSQETKQVNNSQSPILLTTNPKLKITSKVPLLYVESIENTGIPLKVARWLHSKVNEKPKEQSYLLMDPAEAFFLPQNKIYLGGTSSYLTKGKIVHYLCSFLTKKKFKLNVYGNYQGPPLNQAHKIDTETLEIINQKKHFHIILSEATELNTHPFNNESTIYCNLLSTIKKAPQPMDFVLYEQISSSRKSYKNEYPLEAFFKNPEIIYPWLKEKIKKSTL